MHQPGEKSMLGFNKGPDEYGVNQRRRRGALPITAATNDDQHPLPAIVRAVKDTQVEPLSLEDQIAKIGRDIHESRARGDRLLEQFDMKALPPTPGNVFAANALALLHKREEILTEAKMRADELEQAVTEMIACGARIQDFQQHSQQLAQAIRDARPALTSALPASVTIEAPQGGDEETEASQP
jgi:hypothetical protein